MFLFKQESHHIPYKWQMILTDASLWNISNALFFFFFCKVELDYVDKDRQLFQICKLDHLRQMCLDLPFQLRIHKMNS